MISAALIALCGIMSFVSYKSSFWIFKFLTGLTWWALGAFWVATPIVPTGTPASNILTIVIFIIGFGFMLMPFWFTKEQNGEEHSHFRLPGMKEEEPEKPKTTRSERIAAYEARANNAVNGGRERK